ncbi:hypothetical protein, partial [Natrinema soli]
PARDREGTGDSQPARHRVVRSTRGHSPPGAAHAGVAHRVESVIGGPRCPDLFFLVAEEFPDQMLAAIGHVAADRGLFGRGRGGGWLTRSLGLSGRRLGVVQFGMTPIVMITFSQVSTARLSSASRR